MLADWVYRLLGREWAGMSHVPDDHLTYAYGSESRDDQGRRWRPYVAMTSNLGFDLCMGIHDHWYHEFSFREAIGLAWFIIWRWWIVGRWFGLRRWLWFWALARRVERQRPGYGSFRRLRKGAMR